MKVDAAMQRMPLQAVNTSAQRVNEETSNTPQALREDSVSLSSVNQVDKEVNTISSGDYWGYVPPN